MAVPKYGIIVRHAPQVWGMYSLEIVQLLSTVELLRVSEKVDVRVLLRAVVRFSASRHDGVGFRFSQIASRIPAQRSSGPWNYGKKSRVLTNSEMEFGRLASVSFSTDRRDREVGNLH